MTSLDNPAPTNASPTQRELPDGHKVNLDPDQANSGRTHQLTSAQRQLADMNQTIGSLEEQLQAQARDLADREAEAAGLRAELVRWQSSRLWQLGRLYWHFRASLKAIALHVLPGSLLRRIAAWRWRSLVGLLFALLPRPAQVFYQALRYHGYLEEDNSQVVVYYKDNDLFQDYAHRKSLALGNKGVYVPVSLVVTVRNEQATAHAWLDALQRQTMPPDEVIIVDGGSTDGTLEQLQKFARTAPFETKVIATGGVNIARGKNIGIAQASHATIVNTDFGCDLELTWLEYLVRPFELDETLEVVAGWYEARSTSLMGRAAALELIPILARVHPQTFIPSTRSIAFRKSAWELVAGYPEWLSLTGDDTYFGLELKRVCRRWAFVPEARVFWHAPDTIRLALLKAYRWSIGDGEAGLFADRYWQSFMRVANVMLAAVLVLAALAFSPVSPWLLVLPTIALVALVIYARRSVKRQFPQGLSLGMQASWLALLPFMQVGRLAGFAAGVRSRPAALRRRYASVSGAVLLLSGVPFTDSGGGPRSTQLALEFLRRGYLVVFINKFPRYESVVMDLTYAHPNLLTFTVEEFDLESFFQTYRAVLAGKDLIGIVEFPLPDFVPLIKRISLECGHVVYDLIDDWLSSLGARWYSRRTDQAIIELSDVLVATAPSLQQRLEGWSSRPVALLHNAVNPALFSHNRHYDLPADMPTHDFVICYVGALWGEWFDWRLLRKIALAFPEAAVVVIGDYRNQCPSPPPNLHFLGLKPQIDLAAYLAYTHVAIIPWKVSPITHATNPLKVYEYLAMGKPVVAPRLHALEGIPFTLLSNDDQEFIANIGRGRRMIVDTEMVEAFVENNSWSVRVDRLLELIHKSTRL